MVCLCSMQSSWEAGKWHISDGCFTHADRSLVCLSVCLFLSHTYTQSMADPGESHLLRGSSLPWAVNCTRLIKGYAPNWRPSHPILLLKGVTGKCYYLVLLGRTSDGDEKRDQDSFFPGNVRPFVVIINLSAGSIQGPSTKVL